MTIKQTAHLHEIIREELDLPESHKRFPVTDESKILDDLGADSLDKVALIMAIEDEFEIEIEDREADAIRTVGDLRQKLDSLITDH